MKIWIFNHYATNQFVDGAGRHQGLAKYLIKRGHNVKIFCANTLHNSEDVINIKSGIYASKKGDDDVEYVFVKTSPYVGNGGSRIKNMIMFWLNLPKVVSQYIKEEGRPDVFLASSVHPLTLVAGLSLKRKYKVPCICEIRDIWPLSLVDFGIIPEKSLINKVLLVLEKWTYKRADKVIFTMAGGKEYIADMGWGKCIPKEKILYLNNGVDLERFDSNVINNAIEDVDFTCGKKNFIYAGSIGMADKLERLVELAEKCSNEKLEDIQFLVYGSGSEKSRLENLCIEKKLPNIKFKGRVKKEQIPYIVSKSYANIFFLEDYKIYKYGISLNKFFEYLAAGKPIITNRNFGYNQIIKNNCGFVSEDMFESIKSLCLMESKDYDTLCNNSRKVSTEYSFECLSEQLEGYITNM